MTAARSQPALLVAAGYGQCGQSPTALVPYPLRSARRLTTLPTAPTALPRSASRTEAWLQRLPPSPPSSCDFLIFASSGLRERVRSWRNGCSRAWVVGRSSVTRNFGGRPSVGRGLKFRFPELSLMTSAQAALAPLHARHRHGHRHATASVAPFEGTPWARDFVQMLKNKICPSNEESSGAAARTPADPAQLGVQSGPQAAKRGSNSAR